MKTITSIIIFFLFTNSILCQNFTVAELIKINNYELDDFDTYVNQKGYKYYENESTEFSDRTSYAYSVNGVNKLYISKYFRKLVRNEMVSFLTSNNATYLKIKLELKKLGFKLVKTGTFENTTYFDYRKGKTDVSLTLNTQEGMNGHRLSSYEISVTRND